MPELSTTRRRMLQVDFFTTAHRLSTQMNVYGRPLADQLNDPRVSWIELEMAYISRIERPAEIIADYAISTLRKDHIQFAMISGSTDGAIKKIAMSSASLPTALARPKSSRNGTPASSTKILVGFRSRWTTPCSCA